MYEGPIQELIDELGRLPGIGPKSAQRIAFHLLQTDKADVARLSEVLIRVTEQVRFCEVCFNISSDERCRVCRDPRRDRTAICVVEESKDVQAIERTREFRGLYHVLGGAISPIDHVGPADLHIRELLTSPRRRRRHRGDHRHRPQPRGRSHRHLPVAHHPAAGGVGVPVGASGLPVGGDLEYADEITLGRAFSGRRLMS